MATFGSTSETTAVSDKIADEAGADGLVRGNLFTLSENGNVTSIQAYLSGTNAETAVDVKYAVYNSSLVFLGETESSPWDISGNEWIERNFTVPLELTAGDYWLVALGDYSDFAIASSALSMYGASSGGTSRVHNIGASYTFPDPVAGTTGTRLYDIYATYTPATGGVKRSFAPSFIG